jgi:hypothetical protein
MEKLIFKIKLERRLTNDLKSRVRQMELLKRLLAYFLEKKVDQFHVSEDDWKDFGTKIAHKRDEIPE